MSPWTSYYTATANGGPRETLLQALASWTAPPGIALDLGCGTGRDTFVLLEQGWQVHAVDAEAEALGLLRQRISDAWQIRLETHQARLETVELPSSDLINASFALPFCEPARFPNLWERISAAVRPGGLFCGQLFGERDSWASKGVTLVKAAELQQLLHGWEVLLQLEEEEDGHTPIGRPKHWHIHHLVLRRR